MLQRRLLQIFYNDLDLVTFEVAAALEAHADWQRKVTGTAVININLHHLQFSPSLSLLSS